MKNKRPNKKKSILFISNAYPPNPAVGGKRIEKMRTFFEGHSFDAYVVAETYKVDKEVMSPKGDERTVYVKSVNNPVPLSSGPWPEYGEKSAEKCDDNIETNILQKISRELVISANLIRHLLVFPDNKNLWIVGGFLTAMKIIRKHGVQYVLSSSPPFSSNIIGILLKVIFPKVFLIVDFRDPFVFGNELYSRDVILVSKKRLLEWVVTRADLVLVTTEHSLELLEQLYSDKTEGKVLILPNGITTNLFKNVNKQKEEGPERVLCHLGDLDYKHRNPEPLIRAVYELISEGRIRRDETIIQFYGQSGTWGGKTINDMVKGYGLKDTIRVYETVPHDAALTIMKNCDGLVLLAENQREMIPAKTYEYLYAGKPILCFVDKGSATYNLLKNFKDVWLVSSEDMNNTKDALAHLLRYPKGQERTLTETEMKKISFEYHLDQVIELFDKRTQQA